MADQPLQIQGLFAAMAAQIADEVPQFAYVSMWPDLSHHVDLPALLLDLGGFEPAQDPGTGEFAIDCQFEAYVVVASELDDHLLQAAVFSTRVATLLRGNNWGMDKVGPARFAQASQDWTRPELDGYTVWKIEWGQELRLGEENWPWPDGPTGQYRPPDPDDQLLELTP